MEERIRRDSEAQRKGKEPRESMREAKVGRSKEERREKNRDVK